MKSIFINIMILAVAPAFGQNNVATPTNTKETNSVEQNVITNTNTAPLNNNVTFEIEEASEKKKAPQLQRTSTQGKFKNGCGSCFEF